MTEVLIVGAGFYRHIYDLQLKGAIEALEAGGRLGILVIAGDEIVQLRLYIMQHGLA